MRTRLALLSSVLLVFLAVALRQPAADGPAYKSRAIEVYFSPGGGAEEALVDAIRDSKESVEVAIFTLTSSAVTEVLETRATNGVTVRVLADEVEAKQRWSKVRSLERSDAGLEVRRFVPGDSDETGGDRPKMHHKFCVIDGRTVITGSYNYSRSADRENCENLLLLRDKKLAAVYRAEFERLWKLADE